MQQDELIQHEIEKLLRQKIGLNPESINSRAILRAAKKGMRAGKMQGFSAYLSELQASPDMFDALVESVVVPETSFFRNRASFVFLRQWVSHEWQGGRPLRVLSLPCSTGEEPYSIAITLLEEGLLLDDFQLDAVDISAKALEKAKQGIYSPYAFRRQGYRSDDKYFTLGMPDGVSQGRRITQRYFLSEEVRNKVRFRQGNVLDSDIMADQQPYDIVFCRNLLIYFDQAARDRTFKKLTQLLYPQGLLFLGYAETSMVDSQQYQSIPYPQTFAYRKLSEPSTLPTDQRPSANVDRAITMPLPLTQYVNFDGKAAHNIAPSAVSEPAASGFAVSPEAYFVSSTPEMTLETTPETVTDFEILQTAQQLADIGDMDAASALCDRYLAQHPAVAAAHLLRGELYQAAGDEPAAETCFEKAIYLDPQMSAALTHLMLLKEEHQDMAGVALMRERLRRIG